ncbi:hypothetical protein NMY22_g3465 [Coprinellus aureogranulatus]|nr:hypothetical protein NMY22_g3465 [Coprinellus aureogranulatus]
MFTLSRKLAPIPSFVRAYAPKYPRPRPGTAERPPLKHRDPLLNSPNATVTKLEDDDLLFVHRPPPSLEAPESTTALPASPLLQKRPASSSSGPVRLPPLVKGEKPKELKPLTPEDIAKMKELRASDPEKYSASKLAKMFGCTRLFVSQNTRIRTSQKTALWKKRDAEHEKHRARWSERHQLVKAVRAKRKEMW